MNPVDLLPQLQQIGMREAYVEYRFYCYRDIPNRGTEQVTVSLLDGGPNAGGSRYHVIAESESGRRAGGNPHDDPIVALSLVHWWDLEK